MSSYSIYRGPADKGEGESPDNPGTRGEQYLKAAPELWQKGEPEIAEAARPWMTLDARGEDYSLLGDNLEAWSCFPFEGRSKSLRFVVRLVSFGSYDRRRAYFAHGRAWEFAECRAENDPGSLLGAAAFAAPWRDTPLPFDEPPIAPALDSWRELLNSESEQSAAASLIAQLYKAHVTGAPVVVSVAPREFAAGAPLHRLIALARAALPWEFKKDTRIRVYTSLPSAFLQKLKAHLIAIPETLAGEAMQACPEAVLLDRNGRPHGGAPKDPQSAAYERYAETVLGRFMDSPSGLMVPALLPFSARVVAAADISPAAAPHPKAMDSIANVYDFIAVAGVPAEGGKLLRFLFHKQANKNAGTPQPWNTIIPAELLCTLPEEDVREVVRAQALTNDARALKELVSGEAMRRQLTIQLPDDAPADLVVLFQERKFVDASTAVVRLIQAPVAAIFDVLLPGGPRTAMLVRLLGDRQMPDRWQAEFLGQAPLADVVGRLLTAVVAFGPGASLWMNLLSQAIKNLLETERPSVDLANQISRLPEMHTPEGAFLVAEILHRSGSETARRRVEKLVETADRETRRWIFRHVGEPHFTCLDGLAVPEEWDPDVVDLWPEAPASKLRQLKLPRLLRIFQGRPLPSAAMGLLNERMEMDIADLRSTAVAQNYAVSLIVPNASALNLSGRWLEWRSSASMLPGMLRDCAQLWLLLNHTRPVKLEEWKQAVQDLQPKLKAAEVAWLRAWFEKGGFVWPHLSPLFDDDQLEDLVRLAGGDWGILMDISETGFAAGPVQRAAFPGLPTGVLEWLGKGKGLLPRGLTVPQLVNILRTAGGHFTGDSKSTLAVDLFKWDCRAAISIANEFDFWADSKFRFGLFQFLYNSNPSAVIALEPVISKVPLASAANLSQEEYWRLGERYRMGGCPQIANWLLLGAGRQAKPTAVTRPAAPQIHVAGVPAISCLLGRPISKAWAGVAAQIDAGHNALGILRGYLQYLDREDLSKLERHGWQVFKAACKDYVQLLHHRDGRVQAVDVVAFIENQRPIADVAAEIITLRYQGRTEPDEATRNRDLEWWGALFDTVADCPRRPRPNGYAPFSQSLDQTILRIQQSSESLAKREKRHWLLNDMGRALQHRRRGKALVQS